MKNLILSSIVAASIALAGCTNSDDKNEKQQTEDDHRTTVYTCPMHPEVTSDKPGACPKCNMDLVKKE